MKNFPLLLFIKSIGFFLSRMPYSFLEKLTVGLAFIFIAIPTSRRRLLLSNFSHVFTNWCFLKVKSAAKDSAARMFEMGLFTLCYPFMNSEQRRRTVFYDKNSLHMLEKLRTSGNPVLFLLPHVCLFETLATSPLFRPFGGRTLGAIYRPNKNKTLDDWITKSREKVGLKTFSRVRGLIAARAHLKNGNWLALLYDQNAGHKGKGHDFLGRICSISPLPDLLAKGQNTICVHAIAKRISFFRSRLYLEIVSLDRKSLARKLHKNLEQKILSDTKALPEWLWGHGKWKINNVPSEFFTLQPKFSDMNFSQSKASASTLFIRVPNWLGDVVMSLPLIYAIRKNRPDLHISLICKSEYSDWLSSLKLVDSIISINPKSLSYLRLFYNLRKKFPDAYLVFTNSFRGDLESYLSGAAQRFGLVRRSKRPLLNCTYTPARKTLAMIHQTQDWIQLLNHFGLKGEISFDPPANLFNRNVRNDFSSGKPLRIGIAPGSNNTPDKRLPIEVWVNVCKLLLSEVPPFGKNCIIDLFGTPKDKSICDTIEDLVRSQYVENQAGKTTIITLAKTFQSLNFLVCNDSGAMHLANSVGTPVIAVFGATDPKITGPIYSGSKIIIQQSNLDKEECISRAILNAVKQLLKQIKT